MVVIDPLVRARLSTTENAPTTLILDDEGKQSASGEVSERVNRGEQAIAIDLRVEQLEQRLHGAT